ncbi:hypothetical protein [uncultured Nitrosomonas sp.]|nr:hypothetical protein [uncultured Nitrosomonas sp.]
MKGYANRDNKLKTGLKIAQIEMMGYLTALQAPPPSLRAALSGVATQ